MSNKTNSIVEVNGSRYDAHSGKRLGGKLGTSKKVIDGFMRAPHQARSVQPAHHTIKAGEVHKRTQKSTTLMRKAVKKPHVKAKQPEKEVPSAPESRINRAKASARHEKVNRFGVLPSAKARSQAVVPAKLTIEAKASYRERSGENSAPRMPSMISSVSHRKLEQLLDEALLRADAHKQMMRTGSQKRIFNKIPRWVGFTAIAVTLLAVGFWFIWQNLPAVAVHVAAARAHVNASIPSYMPSGYSLAGPVQYQDGAVTLNLADKSRDSKVSVTQKASNWDSASLAENILPKDDNVQTSSVSGTTVYIYGKGNDAAWVNHGVLYKLSNGGQLSSDQVLKIVQGL